MAAKEHIAVARGFNVPVSRKFSLEVARFIRGRDLKVAKRLLQGVMATKVAVPFTKYHMDLGHKRGPMAQGRYPVKVAEEMLSLLNSAEMNAANKGLDVDALYISNVLTSKGNTGQRGGRHGGRHTKRTHIEVQLEEREKAVKKEVKAKTQKKGETK